MYHNVLALVLSLLLNPVFCDVIVYARSSGQVMEEFRDLPARFGPKLSPSGTRYLFVEASPKDACNQLVPAQKPTTTDKWAVVIARYNCSFEDKVRAAQKADFDAAIVYNIGSNELEQMSAKTDDGIVIPSVFVGDRTGKLLINSYQDHDEYAIIINDDLPFDINTHLIVPFSVVVGLCFITMIGFMIVKCVREQRRLRRYRLPSSLLKKIPTIKFAKGDNYDTCAICLDDYAEGDKLRVLPCSHAYHTKCIDPWLTKNRRVCPICKRKVFARGEPRHRRRRSSSDSMSDSDTDDRTPLLNPVENSSNHGTFPNQNGGENSVNAENPDGNVAYQPPPRVNPFDRVIPPSTSQVENDSEQISRWDKFKRLFARRPPQQLEVDAEPQISVIVHPNVLAPASAAVNVFLPPRSSSNNLLNTNLSGSFKDEETLAKHLDSDDELLKINEPTVDNNSETELPPTPRGRLGVAAIPNNNFNALPSRNLYNNNDTQII